MNAPVTSNHQQSYTIIQGSQPPILASPPTSVATLQPGVSAGSSGVDVHICGTCGTHFNEIKEFVSHKRQNCQTGSSLAVAGSIPQLSSTSPVHQAHSPVQMGVPVGMPHVILQTASGPPQMYRIVLEPSVANSPSQGSSMQGLTPILAQALSGSQMPHVPTSSPQQAPTHSQTPQTSQQAQEVSVAQVVDTATTTISGSPNGTLLQIGQNGETWHGGGEAPLATPEAIEAESGRSLVEDPPPDTLDANGNGVACGSPQGSSETGRVGEQRVSIGTPTSSTMHTEEEDVATFLATQLASQAAPHHNSAAAVSEQVMCSVNGVPNNEAHLHYTSAPTQPQHPHHQQHQHMQQLHMQQHTPQVEFYGATDRSLEPPRKLIKRPTTAVEESAHSSVTMDSKADIFDPRPTKENISVHNSLQSVLKERSCPYKDCNFTTSHSKDLNRHMRKHTGEKPYRCDECGTSFSRGDKLKVHKRIHSNVRPYWCQEPDCQYRAIDSGSLRKHMRTHTNERPYRCQLCPYSARDGSQLTVHLRTHTGDTPFQCMIENCAAAFKTSSDLRRHERLHTGVKPYKCTACDYACAIKSNLTVHMRLNHFQGAKFSCSKCDYVGNSRKQLKDHEKTHAHVVLHCDLCEHVSTSRTGLMQHMLIHSQERPFQCRYCSFTCKTTGNLRYHVRNKHGCEVSGRKRGNAGNNNIGGRGRSASSSGGRRPSRPSCYRSFKCSDCGSGFVREDSYRSHMRQHQKYKMAQAISGKMEPDVFNVVVQDENILGVEQPGGTESTANAEPNASNFGTVERMPSEALHTTALPSQNSVPGNGGTQPSDPGIGGYNSYVITIDGISTVFPNPVRLSGTSVTTETGEQLPGTVQVISGDLISPSNAKPYDLNADEKVSTHHGYGIAHKVDTQLYDLTSADKSNQDQSSFSQTQGQVDTGSSSEYMQHPTSPQDVQQTVLVDHQQEINLQHSIQVHNMTIKDSKPKQC